MHFTIEEGREGRILKKVYQVDEARILHDVLGSDPRWLPSQKGYLIFYPVHPYNQFLWNTYNAAMNHLKRELETEGIFNECILLHVLPYDSTISGEASAFRQLAQMEFPGFRRQSKPLSVPAPAVGHFHVHRKFTGVWFRLDNKHQAASGLKKDFLIDFLIEQEEKPVDTKEVPVFGVNPSLEETLGTRIEQKPWWQEVQSWSIDDPEEILPEVVYGDPLEDADPTYGLIRESASDLSLQCQLADTQEQVEKRRLAVEPLLHAPGNMWWADEEEKRQYATEWINDLHRAHEYLDAGKPFFTGKDCSELAEFLESLLGLDSKKEQPKFPELSPMPEVNEYYRHYNGGFYRVTKISTMEATGVSYVDYESVSKLSDWLRPVSEWREYVKRDGLWIPRFEHVDDSVVERSFGFCGE